MANNGLTKNYLTEAAISAFRIVKMGAADYGILTAAAVSDKLIGITTEIDSISGERCDVVHAGIADLKLGGAVARGDQITSDATGQGLTAAPAAGTNNRTVGIALISGVLGDIIPVLVLPSMLQG